MYCKKCGSKIRDNAKFCPKCGAVLKSSSASVDSNSVNDTTDKIASSIKKDTANGKRIIVLGIGAVAAIVVIGIIVFAIKRPSTEDIKGTEIASESTSEGIDSAENTSDSKNDMDSSEELADAPQTEGTVQMWMGTDPAQAVSDESPEDKSEAKDMLVESTEEGSYENKQDEDNELIPDFGYVKVAAPDGGVNMRTDADTEYDIVVNMIPNDTELPVYEIKEASSGKKWGRTSYGDKQGWIALSQTDYKGEN